MWGLNFKRHIDKLEYVHRVIKINSDNKIYPKGLLSPGKHVIWVVTVNPHGHSLWAHNKWLRSHTKPWCQTLSFYPLPVQRGPWTPSHIKSGGRTECLCWWKKELGPMETSCQMEILSQQDQMLLFLELSIQTKAERPFFKEWMKDFNSKICWIYDVGKIEQIIKLLISFLLAIRKTKVKVSKNIKNNNKMKVFKFLWLFLKVESVGNVRLRPSFSDCVHSCYLVFGTTYSLGLRLSFLPHNIVLRTEWVDVRGGAL